MELLAPAGDMERLEFALRYGADAVYLAGQRYGMRASPGNFDETGLRQAVQMAHGCGVRVYLACNSILRNADVEALPAFLEFAQEIGIDALILADLGAFALAKKYAPRVARHVSTQAGVLNTQAARAWYDLGAKRVVLAREMRLNEIADLRANVSRELEIEVFVHGAMCVSFSGRCLLSQYLTGRDANQGDCAQPCRWKYQLTEEHRPGEQMEILSGSGGTHIMNARDLCMIDYLPELHSAGVNSLKIEGRAKSFYYAAVVTNAYRKAVDAAQASIPLDSIWRDEVEKVSHRAYETGFFYDTDRSGGGQYTQDALYIRKCEVVGVVESCNADGLAHVSQRNRFFIGDTLELLTPNDKPQSFVVTELFDEHGRAIESAPHPKMGLRLQLPQAAERHAILRKNI